MLTLDGVIENLRSSLDDRAEYDQQLQKLKSLFSSAEDDVRRWRQTLRLITERGLAPDEAYAIACGEVVEVKR